MYCLLQNLHEKTFGELSCFCGFNLGTFVVVGLTVAGGGYQLYAHARVASSRSVVQVCDVLRQFSPPTVLFLPYIKCAPVQRSSGQGQRV